MLHFQRDTCFGEYHVIWPARIAMNVFSQSVEFPSYTLHSVEQYISVCTGASFANMGLEV